jgi:SAM-dependent methyltransferase
MTALDPEVLKNYQLLVFGKLEGAVTSMMIHLGDRLGLYGPLAADGHTTAELAARTGLDERWVREWAYNQAAAGIITADDEGSRFSLSPEGVAVLADESSEFFGAGEFGQFPRYLAALERLPESFRSGVGHDYDSHGRDTVIGLERMFEPWNRKHLVADVLVALDGVVESLTSGAEVADIGCGAGGAVLMIAAAFPNSRVTGYDTSRLALERAAERLADSRLGNAHFADPRLEPPPNDHRLRLVTTFDCLHDMTDPQGMVSVIREAVADDGTWLLVDIKARDTFAENAARNPMAPLMYGFSVLTCLSSGLAERGGAGLGTLGLPESKARQLASDAGFTRFRRLAVDHPVEAFYEIRP